MERENAAGIYINRELSWLKFNERVLEEAEDAKLPLLERLKFVSIFGSNLDEFFMVRVGSLYDQSVFHPNVEENKCHMTAGEQMHAVFETVPALLKRKDAAFRAIMASLDKEGITKVDFDHISAPDEAFYKSYFIDEIFPLLSPQIVDKHHPFPFLRNNEVYIGVHMRTKSDQLKLGLVPVGAQFERVHLLNTERGVRLALIEDMIYHFADSVFTKYTIASKIMLRVTRNADLEAEEALYDEDIDWRDMMQDLLKTRRRLAAVRLQVNKPLSGDLCAYLTEKLQITKRQIFLEESPFDVSFAFMLANRYAKQYPHLVNDTLTPVYPVNIDHHIPIMQQALTRDLLLSFPYHSIRPFVRLLEEAAADETVASIKISLYRVAKNSQILSALLKAAENGKQVLAVLELRARFDEQNNIDWSKQLEQAGCTVIYGLDEYKVHSKLLLITRRVDAKITYVTQIGTGNYNEKTAELYTDLSVVTTDHRIGIEALNVFNNLALGQTVEYSELLLVAPNCFSQRLIDLINREITYAKSGEEAFMMLKCNAVTDKEIIDKLIEASQAGVKIKMLVRGICCFRPGVPGYTDNITVKSIVGRFLEHSRIYVFGTPGRRKIYISSADLMTRNTQRRIEVAMPVLDGECIKTIMAMLQILDADNVKARIMLPDGSYDRYAGAGDAPRTDAQRYFFEMFANEAPIPNLNPAQKRGFWHALKAWFKRR